MKSIADVVSASGLAGYAEIALLLFFFVFVAVSIRALAADRAAIDRAARLPLDDDLTPSASGSFAQHPEREDRTAARES